MQENAWKNKIKKIGFLKIGKVLTDTTVIARIAAPNPIITLGENKGSLRSITGPMQQNISVGIAQVAIATFI
ncbi:TPA: hypothetical protein OMI24_004567 [Escherichia coli]|nr:hypothetical protein [Escherichia coli]HBI7864535.1 hypothetical protein [Escherichia coli]HCQ8845118.1 hypothetical protein [Escherichia coli]HDX7862733.1 hypothetical protein [Escherichia coli]HEI3213257.1 hypothetical protein [Escherichia coli]